MTTLTEEIAIKVRDTVSCGLVKGLGIREPGKMCIEAAVCFAYGLPHSDNPPCVGRAVRSFKIRLNDSKWSSNEARAKGMIGIAIAQLGSSEINQIEFSKRVTIKTINTIIADLATKYLPGIESELRSSGDLPRLRELCQKLRRAAADAAAYAADAYAADAYAADAAAYAADAYADAAYAADAAAYAAAAYAADAYAADAADAVAYAAYAADAYAADAAASRDSILTQAANICLEVLKEMNSPGCKYLYLLEN